MIDDVWGIMKPTFQDMRSALQAQRMKVSFDTYDLTCDELTRRILKKRIDIAPEYQRQFRWDDERQSCLIESVLLGIPVPNLFMATSSTPDEAIVWEVVDGLQRSLSIVNFILEGEQREELGLKAPLCLKGLSKLPELNGCCFSDLPEDMRSIFLDRPIKVTVLNDKSDRQVRFDLFERLNTGGISLTSQEVRSCIYRGVFLDLINELSSNVDFRTVVVVPKNRQSDGSLQEYVLRFFAYLNGVEGFKHSVKEFLNSFIEKGNQYDEELLDEYRDEFNRVMNYLARCFPNGLKRGGKGPTPANVFEGVSVGAAQALRVCPQLEVCSKNNWIDSKAFRGYTTSATNSLPKVKGRIAYAKEAFLNHGYIEP